MPEFVLDASAVIAVLLGEPGAELVEPRLSRSAIITVNLVEVVSHFAKRSTNDTDIRTMIANFPVEITAFDEELAVQAGLLIRVTRAAGLSLADRACLALARRLGVTAVTADRAWTRIAATLGVEVELIR
jgi:PIN domain nuclease of toxin-antitoxin system